MLPASLQPLPLPSLTFGFNFSLLADVQTGSQGLSTSRNKPQQITSIPTDRAGREPPHPCLGSDPHPSCFPFLWESAKTPQFLARGQRYRQAPGQRKCLEFGVFRRVWEGELHEGENGDSIFL